MFQGLTREFGRENAINSFDVLFPRLFTSVIQLEVHLFHTGRLRRGGRSSI